jgi:primosomal protein N' (replication factor Y)
MQFYRHEIATRETLNYPPCKRFVEIELKYGNEITIEKEAHTLAMALINTSSDNMQILGPAKPPVHKVKNMFSRKIYIKGADIKAIINLYRALDQREYLSSIFFTPNPVT